MAAGYPLYCYDEFNSIELYPQYTGEYESTAGMITTLPTPPSIPNGYQFEGWYYDQEFSDPVIIGTSWKVITGKEPKVVIYAKWIEIENVTVNSKMTALADEIRELSGTTEAMGLDTMTALVGYANDTISVQSSLISEQDAKIAELAQVLAGKAGGGSGTTSYDTCTVNITTTQGNLYGYCATCFEEGNVVYKYEYSSTNLGAVTITNVICGSSFALLHQVHNGLLINQDVELVGTQYSKGSIFIAPSAAGTFAYIEIGAGSAGAD